MKLALTAFTSRGLELARRLAGALAEGGHTCTLSAPRRLAGEGPGYDSLGAWTGEQFRQADALIFVGACGIAVRAIAPFVRDKFTDPAVVSVDEAGRFVVPLLSGHVGGANGLALRVAALTGGQAAISTATDVNGLFAVDVWAKERGMHLSSRALAKEVSAALLEGKSVGFRSDFGHPCPPGLSEDGDAELGIWVTDRWGEGPFPKTLRLVPKSLILGVGCRRGTPAEAIEEAALEALEGLGLWAVAGVATIDLKGDEAGLLAFCERHGWPLTTYSAGELARAEGDFTPSAFVASVTGVDNVCERAAVLGGGALIVPKRAKNGVTTAVARRLDV